MQWDIKEVRTILQTHPFDVEEVHLFDRKKQANLESPYYRLKCPDWVNVLPVTADGKAVLIQQSRVGSFQHELETPGGVVDSDETKDPTLTAARELEEETGYTSQRILSLGSFNPNPAIMNNRVHIFVALGAHPNPTRQCFPDEGEDISVSLYPVSELNELVRHGRISHSLSAMTVLLALPYLAKYC